MTSPTAPLDMTPAPAPAPRVLYVGTQAETMTALLGGGLGHIDFLAEERVTNALFLAASRPVHVAVIDQIADDDSHTLMIAALAASKHPPRIVVLAQPEDAERFRAYPGVCAVLCYPLAAADFQAAVMPDEPERPDPEPVALAEPVRVAKLEASPGLRRRMLSTGRFMSAVSALYKNAAFVLLATLFAAFTFYGFLIGFFLLSSGWGAPITLSKGHELVERTIRDLGEMKVELSSTEQKISEARLEAVKAEHDRDDARTLVDYMKGTIELEIDKRSRQIKLDRKTVERLKDVVKMFEKARPDAMAATQSLYKKRLITKKNFETLTMGGLEGSQRVAMLAGDLDKATENIETNRRSIDLLMALIEQLEQGKMSRISNGNTELMLLTKDVLGARSSLDQAIAQTESARSREEMLKQSATFIAQRIATVEQGPLGRAALQRVDVIFVPYGNERDFKLGSPLYSCALTVLFCHRAGTVGAAVPGEANAVHPFFGKPIRGMFVEATLDDPDAASQEIIHARRPPFFF